MRQHADEGVADGLPLAGDRNVAEQDDRLAVLVFRSQRRAAGRDRVGAHLDPPLGLAAQPKLDRAAA